MGWMLALAAASAAPVAAQVPLSAQDSFRIGSGGNVLCSATSLTTDAALADMFDRAYSVVCRDAAVPVGQLYALRIRQGDPAARLSAGRADKAICAPGEATVLPELGSVETLTCRLRAADAGYRVYLKRSGNTLFVAEGLAGYDSALQLALRSLVADRAVEGEVAVATTGAGDAAAFARVQAGQLDPQRALAEAYRRSNAGSYAESSEYFAALGQREGGALNQAEAMVNEALQKSNLGRHAEADSLFSRAQPLAGADPVTARRLRNYRAIHYLTRGMAAAALSELDRPILGIGLATGVEELVIDRSVAGRLSAESPGAGRLRGEEGLSQEDKAQILDGQALHLRGIVLRLQGRDAEAVAPFTRALENLAVIRDGRIAATVWLRAQIQGELAGIAEARGDRAEAERRHLLAVALLQNNYPGSSALLSAQGRLAGFQARTGRTQEALALFRQIVVAIADSGDSSPGLRRA